MCTHGVNAGQFDQGLAFAGERVGLERELVHAFVHQAEAAGYAEASAKLREAQRLLDGARAALNEARALLGEEDGAARGVSVRMV